MIDLPAIRLALRNHLLTDVPGLPDLHEWENRTFDAPDQGGSNWIREFNTLVSERIVATNTIEHIGSYRIQLVYPLGGGTEDPEEVSGQIAQAFSPGTSLEVSAGCYVTCYRAERLPPSTNAVESWYTVTVAISWRIYSSNI